MYISHIEMVYEVQRARQERAAMVWRTVTTLGSLLFLGVVLGLMLCLGDLLPQSWSQIGDLVRDGMQRAATRGYRLFSDVLAGSLTTTDGMMLTMIAIVVFGAARSAFKVSKIYAL